MDHRIIIHQAPEVLELEREGYFGGRTECFRLGEIGGGPFVSLDVNSMYPYVMRHHLYPYEMIEYNRHFDLSWLRNALRTFGVIARVTLRTDEPAYAVRRDKKTLFPVGEFETVLCTEGLRYALEHGHIIALHDNAVYRMADLFSAYVDYLHPLRTRYKTEGNEVMAGLCKLIENSLYGKFAQKRYVTEEYLSTTGREYYKEESIVLETGRMVLEYKLLNKIIIRMEEEEVRDSSPAITAHITENARMLLWSIIRDIGTDRVLYCDTDSVKIRTADLPHVRWRIHDSDLGALKIEARMNRLYIGGNKFYMTDDDRHIKGIPKSAVEVAPGVWEYEVFDSQDRHLRSERITGFLVTSGRRQVTRAYDKGVVDTDGGISPYVYDHNEPPF